MTAIGTPASAPCKVTVPDAATAAEQVSNAFSAPVT